MKPRFLTTLTLVIAVLVVAGCATPQTRINKNPQLFASYTAEQQQMIKEGHVGIGFTPDMVRLALGEPDKVTRRIDQKGSTEIWRYGTYDNAYYGSFYTYGGWGWSPGFYGRYYGAGPYWGGPYYGGPYWGARWYGGGPYYAADYSAPTRTDHLRVTFRAGQVVEITENH